MSEKIENLSRLVSHGVYVVGVSDGQHRNAFTAAWVMQVSFDPVMLALSINPGHYSYQLLKAGGVCSISVLGQEKLAIAEHFGRSVQGKMAGFEWLEAKTGAPILAESLAYFDCEVSHFSDAGDHKIALCFVVDAARLNLGTPLLYHQTGDIDGSNLFYAR